MQLKPITDSDRSWLFKPTATPETLAIRLGDAKSEFKVVSILVMCDDFLIRCYEVQESV